MRDMLLEFSSSFYHVNPIKSAHSIAKTLPFQKLASSSLPLMSYLDSNFCCLYSLVLCILWQNVHLAVSDFERKFMNSSLVAPSFASRCSSTKSTDAKSGSVDGGFIASVVGGCMDVDCCGGGVKDGNDYGITVENIGEELVITKTASVVGISEKFKNLAAKSDE
ncbi:hypothetical protein Tco_0034349 [Tanacetum coccineum]